MRFLSLWKVSILLPLITLAALVSALAADGVTQAHVTRATDIDVGFYQKTNLESDILGVARFTDPNLVNPWGLSHSPTSPWWVSDNGAGVATLYKGNGRAFPVGSPLVVTIPPPAGGTPPAAPTGNVFNGTSDFVVSANGKSGASFFIFATEDGTISGWNPNVNATNAILAVDNSKVTIGKFTGAVYKGLATGQSNNQNFIYATDFRFGRVEQFKADFSPGITFTDPELAQQCNLNDANNQCFAPFGIQNIGGKLFVTFALQKAGTPGQPGTFKHDDQEGAGNGFVDIFNTDGTLFKRLISHGQLNSPWGLALAPENFGRFSDDLLVGNFGDGHINVFNPENGTFLGQPKDRFGDPIAINGLWGLAFGNGGLAGPRNTLFFTAGIVGEAHGLFGSIRHTVIDINTDPTD